MKRLIALLLLCGLLTGCAAQDSAPSPTATILEKGDLAWPKEKLSFAEDGAPMLDVYVTDAQAVEALPLERYLEGVLAGEMKNDWPLEALKAQAILARTYALKFLSEKESRYPNAEISTDIEEAQAYDASAVNDRVRQAVAETRGMVLSSDGQLPYAWFHAHSGGMTELAKEGLDWEKEEPAYTRVVQGEEPDSGGEQLQAAAVWEASFTFDEFSAAAKKQGKNVQLSTSTQLTADKRGQSGRAVTLLCGDQTLNATSLRLALGSTKMRSTLLTSLRIADDKVYMAGKGYGHGVGMSQWGAYGLAEAGHSAEEIVTHYSRNVTLAKLW